MPPSDAAALSATQPLTTRLAEVAVRVGLNLQPGQDLILTANTHALPLVREIAAAAYRAGAGVVTPILADDQIALARYAHAGDASFDAAPGWLYRGMAEAFGSGAARMAVVGDNPMLLSAQDAARVARANRANSRAYQPALDKIAGFDINWTLCAFPHPAWAALVFPDLPADQAVAALGDAIARASRLDGPDPVAAWAVHNADIHARRDWLNDHRFAALHFRGPGTDLTVGLADGHLWEGGASVARNGVTCNPNIPTEEVFTTPHAARVNGTVRASKPLAHQGTLIDGIEMTFQDGRAVQARATRGEEVLHRMLDTDEGAARLGEVALVPHSSPISQSGILFYNTLFDENAACHIAMGQCYAKCFQGGDTITPDQVAAQGGNSSLIHVDWMIGGPDTGIDGITDSGARVPVFRGGEWA